MEEYKNDLDRAMFPRGKPYLTLGLYESLIALLIWIEECAKVVSPLEVDSVTRRDIFLLGHSSRVNKQLRQDIFSAFLLFGKFDALAGMSILGYWQGSHNIGLSSREFFGDFVPLDYQHYSPFANYLDEGSNVVFGSTWSLGDQDIERLTPAVFRGLKRAGLLGWTDNNTGNHYKVTKREISRQIGLSLRYPGRIGSLWATASLSMIERSIINQRPLFSIDVAGPAWLSGQLEPELQILKIIWEEIPWLPNPTSFKEAYSMGEDHRIADLRKDVSLWGEKLCLGDLVDESDLRKSILDKSRSFQNRSWAAQYCRLITYLAVPASVASVLLHNDVTGLTITGLGAGAQCLSDLMEANKNRSWLSIGRDWIR